MSEVLRCLQRTVSFNLPRLLDLESTAMQMSARKPELICRVASHLQNIAGAEVKDWQKYLISTSVCFSVQERDGAALLLLWLMRVPARKAILLDRMHGMLDCILGSLSHTSDRNQQQAIMRGLSKASEDEQIAR